MKLKSILYSLNEISKKYNTSKPFICGGVARDKFMEKLDNISDLDITTGDDSIKILGQEFNIFLKKKFLVKNTIGNDGHLSIFLKDLKIDFSSNFNAPNIEKLLLSEGIVKPNNMQKEMFSRDFTCNSLLLSINLKHIYDPTGKGIKDINNKIIRCCTNPEFTFNDISKTRAIRCMYISSKLDFDIDPKIIDFLKKNPINFKLPSQKFTIEKINKSIDLNPDRTIYFLNKTNAWNHIPMTEKLLPYYKGNIKKTLK